MKQTLAVTGNSFMSKKWSKVWTNVYKNNWTFPLK